MEQGSQLTCGLSIGDHTAGQSDSCSLARDVNATSANLKTEQQVAFESENCDLALAGARDHPLFSRPDRRSSASPCSLFFLVFTEPWSHGAPARESARAADDPRAAILQQDFAEVWQKDPSFIPLR